MKITMETVKVEVPRRLLPRIRLLVQEEEAKWQLAKQLIAKSKLQQRDLLVIDRKLKSSLIKRYPKLSNR